VRLLCLLSNSLFALVGIFDISDAAELLFDAVADSAAHLMVHDVEQRLVAQPLMAALLTLVANPIRVARLA